MKGVKFKELFLRLIQCGLLVAIGCSLIGCGGVKENQEVPPHQDVSDILEVGEGDTEFDFVVVDLEGNEKNYKVHTDDTVVGDALLAVDLIKGEESQYGLYVKEVNGIIADYDVDGTYWAFYIDGEYASAGVDSTEITEGSIYMFKVEK